MRRALKWVGWTCASLVVILVATILAALYSSTLAGWMVERGLAAYSEAIPGHASVGAVSGRIGGDLILEDLHLQDSLGRSLITAEHVRVGLDVSALWGGRLDVGALSLSTVTVLLPDDGRGGFADLAPPPSPDSEPESPSTGLGPDLPLRIDAGLILEALELRSGTAWESAQTLGIVDVLRLQVFGEGRSAGAELLVTGSLPEVGLRVDELSLRAAWDEPSVVLTRLKLRSSWAAADLDRVELDLVSFGGELGQLEVELDEDWVESTTGVRPTQPWTVSVSASGDPSAASATIEVEAAPAVTAELALSGRAAAPVHAHTRIDARLGPGLLAGTDETNPLHVSVTGSVAGNPQADLAARLSAVCWDCDPRGAPVSVALRAHGKPGEHSGRLQGALFLGESTAWIDGELDEEGAYELRLDLVALELERVAEIVAQFVGTTPLKGRAASRIACAGTLDPLSADCDVAGSVKGGEPVRRAEVGLRVSWDEAVQVEVSTLTAEASGIEVALASQPAHVKVHGPEIDVRDLDVRMKTRTGRGRVAVDAALGGRRPQRAAVQVSNLQLSAIQALVPTLPLSGRIDARIDVEGSTRSPRVAADVRARDLAYAGHRLGHTQIEAAYEDERARLTVRSRGSPLGRVDARARLAARLDLQGNAALDPEAPLQARLRIQGASVADLAALMPEPVPGEGTLGLDLEVGGSLSGPRADLHLEADGLAFRGRALGDLSVDASHGPRRSEVGVVVRHPSIRELRVEAATRLGLDLARGSVDWSVRRPFEASLRLREADLALASDWVPDLKLRGHASATMNIEGDLVEPVIDATIELDAVGYDDHALGDLDLQAGYRPAAEQVDLMLTGKGPAIEGLGLTAEVPIRLSPGLGLVHWHADRGHAVQVALVGLHLDELVAFAPTPVDLQGRGDVYGSLAGPLSDPVLATDAALSRVRYGGRLLGEVELQAGYANRVTDAQLRVQHDPQRYLTASVHAPMELDVQAGTLTFRPDAEHRLRIEAPRIDRELLDPLIELPDDLQLVLALKIEGQGSVDDARLEAELDGDVQWAEVRQRLRTTLVADEAEQRLEMHLGPRAHPSLTARARTEVGLASLLQRTGDPSAAPLEVSVVAEDFDLALMGGLAPSVLANPSGKLDLRAEVDGTLGAPRIDADLRIADGAATIIPARQRIEDLGLQVTASNDRVQVQTLVARSGRGTLEGSGAVTFSEAVLQGTIEVKAQRVPLRSPGLPHMELSTDVRTRLAMTDEQRRIEIDVADTEVTVATTRTRAPKAVPTDDRIRYVELVGPDAVDPLVEEREVTTPAGGGSSDPPQVPTRIAVRLVDPVRILGPAIDMPWGGTVRADLTPTGTQTEGAVVARRGYFDLLGNQFRVEEGQVTLTDDGDTTPFIDLTASTTVSEIDVTARVRGRVTRPELIFSSEPPMTQSQIFTLLVTGAADGQGADEGEVETKAASMLAAFSNPALQRQLNQRLGVDRIGVGFGESTEQPILSVGKHVTKEVYVETRYHHNAPPNANRGQLEVRYQFAPRWSLETFFGDAAAGGVDVFWGRAFDVRSRNGSDARDGRQKE